MKIKKVFNLNNILLTLLSIFLVFNINYDKKISILSFIFYSIIAFLLLFIMQKLLERIKLKSNKRVTLIEYFIYAIIIMIPILFSIIDNVFISEDFNRIWIDFSEGIYRDWHPFLYTVIFVKLPSLVYYSFYSCRVFQGIYIFLCMMYFCYFLRKYFLNRIQTIVVLFVFVLNPTFLTMTSALIKDIPFSYTLMVGTMFLIEIVISQGEWIFKTKNKILFIIMCFFMVYTRHNGIANFLLMMMLLIIFYKKYRKFYLIFFAIFIVTRMIITGPIYHALGVKTNVGAAEMLGVPLNQIRYISEHGKGFSKNYQQKVYGVFSEECFNEKYGKYEYFNSIKFGCSYNPMMLKESSFDFICIWLDLARKNPKLAIKNYLDITQIYWKIDHYKSFYWIQSNDRIYHNMTYDYTDFIMNTIFKYFFLDLGSALFLILFSICWILKKSRKSIKSFIPYILVLSNFAIACCFVTGDEMRFAYPSIVCAYPLMIYALSSSFESQKINGKRNLE